jgi:type I restriction enzyme R subunit
MEEHQREDFYEKLNLYSRCLAVALSSSKYLSATSDSDLKRYKSDLLFFRKLRKYVKTIFSESVDYKEYEKRIEHILQTHVLAKEVTTITSPVDVYSKDFSKDLEGKSDTARALTKLTRLEKHLTEKWKDYDPEYYEKFSKMLQATIEKIKAKRLKDSAALKEADDLDAKIHTRAGDEIPDSLVGKGVALAYYGRIRQTLEGKEQSSKVDLKEVAAEIALTIEKIVNRLRKVDWTKDQDTQNAMKNEIEDYLLDNAKGLGVGIDYEEVDLIIEGVLNIARVRLA